MLSRRCSQATAGAIACALLVGCGGSGQSSSTVVAVNAAHRERLDRKLHRLRHRLSTERQRHASAARAERRERAAAAAKHTTSPRRQESATSPPASSHLNGAVVAIDPGHNGGNAAHPGAIDKPVVAYADGKTKACDTTGTETNDGRLTESLFNLEVARDLAARLRSNGIAVVMTRKTNSGVGPCIDERAAIGNRADADAAISIHADGVEAAADHGFDVIYPQPGEMVRPALAGPSLHLARRVRDALLGAGVPAANYVGSHGLDARDDLGGLNLSTVPKVLVELGNMRSAVEASKLEKAPYRARLAAALAKGVERFLGG